MLDLASRFGSIVPGKFIESEFSPATALRWQGAPLMRRDILAASLAVNMFSLGLPMVLLQVYDRIIPNQAYSTLMLLVIGMAIVLLMDATVKTARAHLAGWVGARFEHAVGVQSLRRLLEADREDLERDPPGRQLDRLAGVDMIRDFYSSQASIAVIDLPFVALFLLLIWYIAGSLALVPLVLLVLFILVAVRLGESLHEAINDRTVWDDRRYNFIIEILSGIHTIKSMSMERLIERRYERLMTSCANSGLKVSHLSGLAQGLGNTFSQITMVAVVSIGSLYIMDSQLSIGGLAACTLLAGRVVQPVLRALGLWTRFQSIRVAEEKLAELEAYAPSFSLDSERGENIASIALEDASFQFEKDGPPILEGVTAGLKIGEVIGIQGNNGSGKTTLLQMFMGTLRPQQGQLIVNGETVGPGDIAKWQREIVYLGQSPVLFDGSVMDNITMFGGEEMVDEAIEIAQVLGLDRVFAAYPEGFDTNIGARAVSNLPGGIGQRVTIARALLRRPSLILFDEANTALDSQGDTLVRDALLKCRETAAVVMVTYRPSLISIADRRYRILDGALVEENVQTGPSGQVGGQTSGQVRNPAATGRAAS